MYRLMVVDDEPMVVEGISKGIDWRQHGVEVVACAYNGTQALKLCEQARPDVVITDIRMPGMDGLNFIERAQQVVPHARFIIVSAYELFAYAQTAIGLHVSAYLVKPVRSAAVVEAVQKAIGSIEGDRNHPYFQGGEVPAAGYSMAEQAKRYIARHLREDISLSDVAAHVNLSPSYFSRQFKKDVGVAFVDYVRRVKIERAKELLTTTNKHVYEIAQELGYLSNRYFTAVFKGAAGMTPQEYRARHRAAPSR